MLLAAVCVVSLALAGMSEAATTPSRCCFEKEFTASLGEVGARVTSGHSSTFTGTVNLAYDFYRKRIHSTSQVYVDGVPSTITRLNDFAQRLVYEAPAFGQCTMRAMPDDMHMVPPCVPADAVFRGHSNFGYGSETLAANTWQFKLPNTSVEVMMSLTEDCVPVFEAVMSHRNNSATEVTLFYTNYNPGIDDMSILEPPSNCVLVSGDNSNTGSTGGNRPVGRRSALFS